jgi:hypothetical protein
LDIIGVGNNCIAFMGFFIIQFGYGQSWRINTDTRKFYVVVLHFALSALRSN